MRLAHDDSHPSSTPVLPDRTFVVVDDHQVLADLLSLGLGAEGGLRCLGVAYDLRSGIELVERVRPELVVMDYQFEGEAGDGIEATAAVLARHPDCCVVLLSGLADAEMVSRAAQAGASALMPKDGALDDLRTALHTTRRGVMVVHPSLVARSGAPGADDQPEVVLNRREHDVLSLLSIGLDVRGIAEHLDITVHTCRGYVKSLLRKLDAHSQLEAVAAARRLGLTAQHGHAPGDGATSIG